MRSTSASVPPGAEVTVFLGTWCGDSRREVPRLWKALDLSGADVPFAIHYIGVDRQKKEPVAPVTNNDIRYVPTVIVHREGREVGRIVEESPHGIEKDLLALLTGQGIVDDRFDRTGRGGEIHTGRDSSKGGAPLLLRRPALRRSGRRRDAAAGGPWSKGPDPDGVVNSRRGAKAPAMPAGRRGRHSNRIEKERK